VGRTGWRGKGCGRKKESKKQEKKAESNEVIIIFM
jgi:ubiquitin C-terminal hydrolase